MNNNVAINVINAKLNPEEFRNEAEKCQFIVEENLIENGGTLKRRDLIELDYDWTYLVVAKVDENRIGFSLVRFSKINKHDITEGGYFYLSQIAVSKRYQGCGVGSFLLEKTLGICNELPLVASVLKGNESSLKLFSKYMTPVNETGKYIRFVDNIFYKELDDSKKAERDSIVF